MQTKPSFWRIPPFGSVLEQAYIRIAVATLFAAYISWAVVVKGHTIPLHSVYWIAFYLFLAFAYAYFILQGYIEGPYQRTTAILVDQGHITYCMYMVGMEGWLFLFLMTWSALGYGVRYGLHWLLFATLTSVLCVSFLITSYPVFDQHPRLGQALLMLQLLVPLYVAFLVKRISSTQVSLVEQTRELETLAYRDHLTGLTNRAGFERYLEKALAQLRLLQGSCALIYFDLDGFKTVNDSHGHAVGDALLVKIAQEIRSHLRPDIKFSRLGGDEFALLVLGEDIEAAATRVARDVLTTCSSLTMVDTATVSITASVGCAYYQNGEDASSLVRRADAAMYQSKRAGKNSITTADNQHGRNW